MAEKAMPTDQVVSYMMAGDGRTSDDRTRLQDLLAGGYRVVQVFQSPLEGDAIVAVTVVLTRGTSSSRYLAPKG